jgi:di/tricarboxylate transporter
MARMLSPSISGISEVVIPPDSLLIGKTLKEIRMSKTYGTNLLAVHRGGQTIRENRSDLVLQSGDVLILHSRWKDLHALAQNRDFVVVTDYPRDETRPNKVPHALVFFAIALSLVLFTDLRLSISLMVGAVGMILSRVLTIDEAYKSVDWKTVFLLASLIPLGMAVETTQTAAWIANQTLLLLSDVPVWVLQAAIAVLGTAFTLVMSNVGATVLLVPLAVNIALGAGADPRIFALTVAISTSNSFLIPTHQVNALIMGPAGYRVADFMKAGGIMTLVFLVVSLAMLNLIF